MWKLKNQYNNKGFTIVELAITIFIITILSGMGVVGLGKLMATNQQTQCINNLREISQGLQLYHNDIRTFPEDGYPDDASDVFPLSTELASYIKTKSIFVCPEDEDTTSISNFASYDPYYVARSSSYQNEELVIGCPRHSDASNSTSLFSLGSTEITDIDTVLANGQAIPADGTKAQRTIDNVNDVMTFADGSTVKIINAAGGGCSCFLIQSVRLADGTLYSIVRVQDNGTIDVNVTTGSKFEIVTPSAIIGVRGTRFTVRTSNGGNKTDVDLTEGTVILMNRNTGEITTLTAGGTTVASVEVNMHSHGHWHADGTYHTHDHPNKNQAHHGNPALVRKAAASAVGGITDNDGDGYDTSTDCDDNNSNVNPGMAEVHNNGIDDDCNPATPDNPEDQAIIDLIYDPSVTSSNLKSVLSGASTLSEDVLNTAINRNPPMHTSDLKDVLLNKSPLATSVLQSIVDRNPPMNTSDIKDVLVNNSPLPSSILDQVIAGTPPLNSGDYDSVIAAQ